MPAKKPAKKVTRSYRVSASSPSERKEPRARTPMPPMQKPQPRSKLTDFVETEREKFPEASTRELILKFQEEYCKHDSWKEIARGPNRAISRCVVCGAIKEAKK